jgi:hypothetical protein
MERIKFGIGCFHFGYHPAVGTKFKGKDYVTHLQKILSKSSNIEKIQILAPSDFLSEEFNVEEPMADIDKGTSFFPFPSSDISINLRIYIPKRVQEELYKFPPKCERFSLNIVYPYYFPFTAVRAIDAPSGYEPSYGVVICRKFLAKSFEGSSEGDIRFEFLGPSPFHAEFSLEQKRNGEDKVQGLFECSSSGSRAYGSYSFYYDADHFNDIDDAYNYLIHDHLDAQFGLFYQITNARSRRIHNWSELNNSLQTILNDHKETGLRAYWRNTLRAEQRLYSEMVELAQIEIADSSERYDLNRDLQSLYSAEKPPELISFLDSHMSDIEIPFKQIKEIFKLLESRRTKRLRLISTLLAAILGGATGAWITLLWKGLG